MPDIRTIIDDVTRLANTVSAVLPEAGTVATVGKVADKVIDIIDTLREHPTNSLVEAVALRQAREVLVARVKAHATKTSSELRGG